MIKYRKVPDGLQGEFGKMETIFVFTVAPGFISWRGK